VVQNTPNSVLPPSSSSSKQSAPQGTNKSLQKQLPPPIASKPQQKQVVQNTPNSVLPLFKSTVNSTSVINLQKWVNLKSQSGDWEVESMNQFLSVNFYPKTEGNIMITLNKLRDYLSQLPEWQENVKEGKITHGILHIECKQEAHAQAYVQALKSVLGITSSESAKLFFKQGCAVS